MTYIEDGLGAHNGYTYGPLADAALRRAARAGQLLDELQEKPEAMTDAELRHEVSRALRHYMERTPRADQVYSLARLIRSWVRIDWPAVDRLPCA
ncbi:hypothetical protein PV371_36740 [Streptomyces sp. TX20-6-3]|uniref:hypothetical protein n=1 Tax=Streptomyces sp. TX20-6-3 TaxID=3028705 RepID=UPI0029B2303F|nr:hypothetical protein [Streptomyces sp. TX20-6-3]MDX2565172.1 hypothetical protein [Streptomyces sp. TX20-6-3]